MNSQVASSSTRSSAASSTVVASSSGSDETQARFGYPDDPPLYRVDLSLSPKYRYAHICCDFKEKLSRLSELYDFALSELGITWFGRAVLNLLLKRVYSAEETEEIGAIAKAIGVGKHLVVAYNTLLDLFSGCVSAGVQVCDSGDARDRVGIVHLRGLDWNMEFLRDLVVRVEYIREGKVIARSVTYAGYIGVLTGVREGLSIAFNYRPNINSSSPIFRHRFHQIQMLLGFRPSVPSKLRRILLSPGSPPTLDDLARRLVHSKTRLSPCYLTFCSPSAILILEKDLKKAHPLVSDQFLVVTNHDEKMEELSLDQRKCIVEKDGFSEEVMVDSIQRKEKVRTLCLQSDDFVGVTRKVDEAKRWLEMKPVKNECTHFSCIMDPAVKGGGLLWVRKYSKPIATGKNSRHTPVSASSSRS
ncbi:hypothetical protein AX17_006832 [Amanita inopinata Kibby_2008]|nr:hypothetical protein AX17_006832 [Amanita inopinata Kibby_2008]